MPNWTEPKTDYVAGDQVTPKIFNDLGENEKYLYEISCKIEKKILASVSVTISNIVFIEE